MRFLFCKITQQYIDYAFLYSSLKLMYLIQVTLDPPPIRLRPSRKYKYKVSSAFTFSKVCKGERREAILTALLSFN